MAPIAMVGIWLLVGVIVSAVDIAARDNRSWQKCLGFFVEDTLFVNLVTLFGLRICLGLPAVMSPDAYLTEFWWKYLLAALAVGVVFLFFKLGPMGAMCIEPDHEKPRILRIILMVLSLIAVTIGAVFGYGAWWFTDFYGVLTTEQFLFNFASPVGGAEEGAMLDLYSRPVFLTVFTVVLIAFLLFLPAKCGFKTKKSKHMLTRKVRQNITMVLCVGLCIGGVTYAYQMLNVNDILKQYFQKSTYIQDNYVDPKSVKLTFPEKKRNLVHIYFESAETSYLDKANGGYMDTNLMPDLMELANTGVHFSHTDHPFGGPHQVFGTSWSVAGMTNMNFGIPLKAPGQMNSYGQNGEFLPGATGYTDILAANGYNETIMFGAHAHFGGLDAFYSKHGTQNIFDVAYARETGLIPPDYNVWWGFEDNKLYDFAKQEITRLAGEGKPFCFMMENADTHYPDGYMEPETQKIFDQQYANVIFHSQKQVTDFIKWIQDQPFGPDTTIVVTGDHLSMDGNFFKDWDTSYERTTFNCFLNADFPNTKFETTNRQYASYDYFPTILSSLGVQIEGDRLALGTNLASNEKTLIERDGVDKVNEETSLYSDFYTKHLLMESDN